MARLNILRIRLRISTSSKELLRTSHNLRSCRNSTNTVYNEWEQLRLARSPQPALK